MRKFLSLLKVQISSQYGLSLARYALKNDKKAVWKGIGIGFAILLALGQFGFFYTFLMIKFHETAVLMKTPQLIITMGAVGAGLFVLFFGIFYILSALFLAKDTEFLSSLPVSQGSVFLSKFTLVLLGEYPFCLFMMLPPVIIYGIGAHKGVFYYLIALVCVLLLPLVPLLISSVLSLGLMKIVSRSRRRDMIIMIGSIVLILAATLGQNYFFSRIPENDPNFLLRIMQQSDGIIQLAGKSYPPAVWITRALSATGLETLANLGYLLLVSAAAMVLVYFLASLVYQKGATAQLETERKTGKTKLSFRASSPLKAMFVNEWRVLGRTPIFALNSLVMILVGPIIMCIPMFGGNFAQDPDIQAIYNLIETGRNGPALPLILAGILALMTSINPAVSSTFSREGKNFWILKNIPVEPRQQVLGKLLAGYSISLMGAVATAIVMTFAFKLDTASVLVSLVLAMLALIPANVSNIMIDLIRPKLNWGNPQEAIKQNANVVLGMLLGALILAVFGFIAFLLTKVIAQTVLLLLLFALLLAAVSVVSLVLLLRMADKSYAKIAA